MSSPFDEIDAAAQAVIAETFGEDSITIRPMSGDVNYSASPDPERPVAVGVRAAVARGGEITPTDFNNSNRNGAPLATNPAELWIDCAAYAALGYRLKRGDRVEIAEAGTPPASFAVAAVQQGIEGDVRVILAG